MDKLEEKAKDKGYLGKAARFIMGAESAARKKRKKAVVKKGLMNQNQSKLLDQVDG